MLDKNKVQEISKNLQSRGIDAFLLGPGDDLEYLSGLKTGECERFKGLFVLEMAGISTSRPICMQKSLRQHWAKRRLHTCGRTRIGFIQR